jgi:hypothetical protein
MCSIKNEWINSRGHMEGISDLQFTGESTVFSADISIVKYQNVTKVRSSS